MNTFVMNLFDATQEQRIHEVSSFVGEDATGYFGLQAYHARFMTILIFGLAKFKTASAEWQYLALPGAVLYFNRNELNISTRHFLIDSDLERISQSLREQLVTEELALQSTRDSLKRMEQAMLQRLWKLNRKPGWLT
jgi:F-type H+-transporting ATPase subunit epsilon